jgi:hypothetical protein
MLFRASYNVLCLDLVFLNSFRESEEWKMCQKNAFKYHPI